MYIIWSVLIWIWPKLSESVGCKREQWNSLLYFTEASFLIPEASPRLFDQILIAERKNYKMLFDFKIGPNNFHESSQPLSDNPRAFKILAPRASEMA